VSGDTVYKVNLEITIPFLMLPTSEDAKEELEEELTQVHLLSINSNHTLSSSAQSLLKADVTTHPTKQGLFNLFHFKHVVVQGQLLLLQLLRHMPPKNLHHSNSKLQLKQLLPVEILPFKVEFRHVAGDSIITSSPIAGLNSVVIYLDEEDIPSNYSIDGAEG
jgi:hypothetical protein